MRSSRFSLRCSTHPARSSGTPIKQRSLARWTFKTVCVLAQLDTSRRTIPLEHYREFRTTDEIRIIDCFGGDCNCRVHQRVTARPYPQRPMVDLLDEDPTPRQSPTLTELEEARAGVARSRHLAIESLMASADAPDIEYLLAQFVSRPAWHGQAKCRGADPDLFFPERGDRPARALAYCEECPVRPQCLASALEVASTPGVWGGTDVRAGAAGPAAWGGVRGVTPDNTQTPTPSTSRRSGRTG